MTEKLESAILRTRMTHRAIVGAMLAALLMLAVGFVPAAAQISTGSDLPQLVNADNDSGENVRLELISPDYSSAPQVSVEEAGEVMSIDSVTTASAAGVSVETMYVLDVHNLNFKQASLDRIAQTIMNGAKSMSQTGSVGLVTAGETVNTRVRLTSSPERLERGLSMAKLERGANILDGIAQAAQVFSTGDDVVRNIVIIAGGDDTGSNLNADAVGAQLERAGIQVMVVRPNDAASDVASILNSASGIDRTVGDIDALLATLSDMSALASDRVIVNYSSQAASGVKLALRIGIAGETIEAAYVSGTDSSGSDLRPAESTGNIVTGSSLRYVIIIAAFLVVVGAVWALGSILFRDKSTLETLVQRYEAGEELDEEEKREFFLQSSLVQRAANMAESVAQERGFLGTIENSLQRADIPVRVGEALFLVVSGTLASVLLVTIFTGNVVFGVMIGLLVAFSAYAFVRIKVSRRLQKFEAQMPDTLAMLSGTLRAGYSLPQGLITISQEVADPMGIELRRAVAESRLGRSIEDSLGAVAERSGSKAFEWVVIALAIQREVGGNLNELLATVGDTMVKRERIRRDVKSLTAEGRLSAFILAGMPPALGVVLYVMNAEYISRLFQDMIGIGLMGIAAVSIVIGLFWMKKVVSIDV